MKYLKSLRSPRIIVILILITLTGLLLPAISVSWWAYVYNFFFWFGIDYSMGLGREEDSHWRNLFGVLICGVTIFLLTLLKL